MTTDQKPADPAAAAVPQTGPQQPSSGGAGAIKDGQPQDPEALIADVREKMTPEERLLIADGLLGKDWILAEYAKDDIDRQVQRRSDRRSVDNQLDIDKGRIDERLVPEIDDALERMTKSLGEDVEPDSRAVESLRNSITTWVGEHRNAEFDHAVRSQSLYGNLTEDEQRRIASVREAPFGDRIRVVLDTLLSARERVTRAEMAQQVKGQVSESKDYLESLTKLVTALGAAKTQTSSGQVGGGATDDLSTRTGLTHALRANRITPDEFRERWAKMGG